MDIGQILLEYGYWANIAQIWILNKYCSNMDIGHLTSNGSPVQKYFFCQWVPKNMYNHNITFCFDQCDVVLFGWWSDAWKWSD